MDCIKSYGLNIASGTEAIDGPLYDTCVYPRNGVERLDFFVHPLGTNNKGNAETNMYLPSCLPRDQYFQVEGFAVECPAVLAKEGELEFVIGNKTYFRYGPITLMRRQHLVIAGPTLDEFF